MSTEFGFLDLCAGPTLYWYIMLHSVPLQFISHPKVRWISWMIWLNCPPVEQYRFFKFICHLPTVFLHHHLTSHFPFFFKFCLDFEGQPVWTDEGPTLSSSSECEWIHEHVLSYSPSFIVLASTWISSSAVWMWGTWRCGAWIPSRLQGRVMNFILPWFYVIHI